MKKGRFLWSAHRITEKQKAGKARNIKEKQLKNSRSTASKPPAALRSSASADHPLIAFFKGTVHANGAFLRLYCRTSPYTQKRPASRHQPQHALADAQIIFRMTKAPPVRTFPARRGFSLCALFLFFLKDEELAQNVVQNNDDDVRRELHHHVVPAEKIDAQVHDEHIQKPCAEARA